MIAAVVLAAGSSARMGKPKLALPVRGKPILERALSAYREADIDEIVVVLGSDAAQLRKKVEFHGERVLYNRRYREGMSSSLRLGLKAVAREADAVMIGLGDQPFLSNSTVDRIIEAYRESEASVVVPVYRGQRGNPVLFDKALFPQIMRSEGDVGAKSVVRSNESSLREVAVGDRGILADIDTPKDYAKAEPGRRAATRVKTPGSA